MPGKITKIGLPNSQINKSHRVQNASARLASITIPYLLSFYRDRNLDSSLLVICFLCEIDHTIKIVYFGFGGQFTVGFLSGFLSSAKAAGKSSATCYI